MNTPTYIAKRVGNEYVMVRVDPHGLVQRSGAIGLGLGLMSYGVYKRGGTGLAAIVAGAGLAYASWTGRSPLEGLKSLAKHLPAYAGTEAATDSVDESSEQSFPASDPPAHQTEYNH